MCQRRDGVCPGDKQRSDNRRDRNMEWVGVRIKEPKAKPTQPVS